ncbi:hypothetical protein I553_8542 [Mycobacterium xenopi 4042]|uniref:Uncharacterized protein n=1 Tax=Mycobacterium xenopi 4042 TaxID=1299334 RepID=X8CK59_MYCXE|nr:hypothetical protein I553_8542 [Mycobacterium xenopi 4042]
MARITHVALLTCCAQNLHIVSPARSTASGLALDPDGEQIGHDFRPNGPMDRCCSVMVKPASSNSARISAGDG